MITVGSLFSGIGGLELGLERTGGFKTIWFSEIDDYASAVLKKHWPETPNIGDMIKVDWNGIEKPDMLTGGFPCQDISVAGRGKGIREGKRSGLWSEYAKAIRILRPRLILIENVPELANKGLDIVLSNLAEIGYDAEWGLLSASAVGALHRRERLFCFAYLNGERWNDRRDNRKERQVLSIEERSIEKDESERNGWKSNTDKNIEADITNNDSERRQRFFKGEIQRSEGFSWCKDVRRIEDLQGRSDIPQPLVRGKDNGFSCRVDRTKCLGNAVVPQVAEAIGYWILDWIK